jgi:uncharacterized protein YbaP (TraB family)
MPESRARIVGWVLGALLALPVAGLRAQSAEPGEPAADPVPVAAGAPVPLLWKVVDGERTVYLLGSFHLLRPDDYPLSADVDAAFADAESLLFEMAPSEMESPTLPLRMGQAALRTDGTLLDSQLPPATAAKLQAWYSANAARLRASGTTARELQMFEPWFVGLTVGIVGMADAGLDPALGIDRHFADAATAAGKPTGGFETGSQQIALLDGMDAQEQVQFLDESLDEARPGSPELETLHSFWRAGAADGLWDRMAADMRRDYPKLYQRINVDRNDAWLPTVEARLQPPGDDDTLVVVGALHLLGSDGLVEKLRARGYAVERICSACTGRP